MPYGTLINVPNANGVNYNLYRPMSYYADVNIAVPDNYLNHHELQAGFNRRSGRYTWMVNYTWGKTSGHPGHDRPSAPGAELWPDGV